MTRLNAEFGEPMLAKLLPACIRGVGPPGRATPVDYVATFWGARVVRTGDGARWVMLPNDVERARLERATRVIEAAFEDGVEVRRRA